MRFMDYGNCRITRTICITHINITTPNLEHRSGRIIEGRLIGIHSDRYQK